MSARQPTRVLILGGGFGGLSAARHFEKTLPTDGSIEVTLVNRDNYLLFTPMLAEVAMGEVNPTHIAVPLRAFLRRVSVRQAEIVGIDLDQRRVTTYSEAADETDELSYDHLILALGSVTSFHHAVGADTYAYPFKHLGDAPRIRDRVLDCFEQAAQDDNPDHRRALLTFVVAGGGFSGVELAAALADFMRETRTFYPSLAGEKLHLVLAHHGQRLLEELDESSAAYTLRLLKQAGIAVRLGTAVCNVAADAVELEPGGKIPTRSVFWTAGVAPSPLVQALPVPKDRHGAVVVDGHLAVQGRPGLWAIGDCASITNPREGGTYAPLAQNAEREGPVVAHNVLATLRGEPLRTFDYRLLGTFASLGQKSAVGRILGHKFSGFPAWLLWRSVYLAKLPGWDRKARVGTDWLLDFVLPADVVAMHVGQRGSYDEPPPPDHVLHQRLVQEAATASRDPAGGTIAPAGPSGTAPAAPSATATESGAAEGRAGAAARDRAARPAASAGDTQPATAAPAQPGQSRQSSAADRAGTAPPPPEPPPSA